MSVEQVDDGALPITTEREVGGAAIKDPSETRYKYLALANVVGAL